MAKAKSNPDARQPWLKWYTRDWRADPPLRMCSYAARGLWADLLTLMHESRNIGFLLIEGVIPSHRQLAGLLGGSEREVAKLSKELGDANVYSITGKPMPHDVAALVPSDMPAGVMLSRRMVRDKAKADRDRENGKGGGNPDLKAEVNEGVNPPANPQRSYAIGQNSEANASGGRVPPREVIFAEGLPWLMRKSGKGRDACAKMIGRWLKETGDDDQAVLDVMQSAEQENPADPFPWIAARLKPKEARETWNQRRIREAMEAIRQ